MFSHMFTWVSVCQKVASLLDEGRFSEPSYFEQSNQPIRTWGTAVKSKGLTTSTTMVDNLLCLSALSLFEIWDVNYKNTDLASKVAAAAAVFADKAFTSVQEPQIVLPTS